MSIVDDLTKNLVNKPRNETGISAEREDFLEITNQRNLRYEAFDKEIEEAKISGRKDSRIAPFLEQPFLALMCEKFKAGNHLKPETQNMFLRLAEKAFLSPDSKKTALEKASFLREAVEVLSDLSRPNLSVLKMYEFEEFLISSRAFPYFTQNGDTKFTGNNTLLALFPNFPLVDKFLRSDIIPQREKVEKIIEFSSTIQNDFEISSFEALATTLNLYQASDSQTAFSQDTLDLFSQAAKGLGLSEEELDTAVLLALNGSNRLLSQSEQKTISDFAIKNHLWKTICFIAENQIDDIIPRIVTPLTASSLNESKYLEIRNKVILKIIKFSKEKNSEILKHNYPRNNVVELKRVIQFDSQKAITKARENFQNYGDCFKEDLSNFLNPFEFLWENSLKDSEEKLNLFTDFCLKYDNCRSAINVFSFTEFVPLKEYTKAYSFLAENLLEKGYSLEEYDALEKEMQKIKRT